MNRTDKSEIIDLLREGSTDLYGENFLATRVAVIIAVIIFAISFAAVVMIGFVPGAAMAWFAAQISVFWTKLSWFGVGAVVLIVLLIVSIVLAEYQRFAYSKERRKALAAGKLGNRANESDNIIQDVPAAVDIENYRSAIMDDNVFDVETSENQTAIKIKNEGQFAGNAVKGKVNTDKKS